MPQVKRNAAPLYTTPLYTAFTAAMLLALAILLAASCAGLQPQKEPDWVSDPYKTYSRTRYLAAVGYGPARDAAEKSALSNLAAIFGQSIDSTTKTDYTWSQSGGSGAVHSAAKSGGPGWTEESGLSQTVETSVILDTLIGAEIRDVWQAPGGTCYAAAVMDRAKSSAIYTEMINTNLKTISKLTLLDTALYPAAEKQSMEGLINYRRAAQLADINGVLSNVQNILSPGSYGGGIQKTGNDYRAEAALIAREIPVAIRVENDRQGRIQAAFAESLVKAGFRIESANSNTVRYVLNANLSLTETSFQNNPHRWIRYTVNAAVTDTAAGTEFFPFSISGREGHDSILEAEERALRAACEGIKNTYLAALEDYYSGGVQK